MGERKPRRPRDIAEHLASLTVLKERMGETAYAPIAVGRKPRRLVAGPFRFASPCAGFEPSVVRRL
jgi:hypothetical protein